MIPSIHSATRIRRVRNALTFAALLSCLLGGARSVADGISLTTNPGFTTDTDYDEWPDGWSKGKGLSWHLQQFPDLSFIRLTVVEPGKSVLLYRSIDLPSSARSLDYAVQARATDVIAGADNWHNARVQFEFRDINNAKIRPVPPSLVVTKAGTADWKNFTGSLQVPQGAAKLVVVGALFYCQSGTMDIGLLTVIARE